MRGGELKEPVNIVYDGQYVRWDAVDDAQYYVLKIDDGQEVKVTSAEYLYTMGEDREFSVTVRACAEKKEDSANVVMLFKPLGAVTQISVEEDAITWAPVAQADSYRIDMGGGSSLTVSDTKWSNFDFNGAKTIKIMPLNSTSAAYYGRYSDAFSFNVLAQPKNVTYDSKTIKWDAVAGKDHYKIKINGVEVPADITANSYIPDAQTGEVKIAVRAIGSNARNTISSPYSETVTYQMLKTITDVTVTDGILSWEAVSGADYYYVNLNGTDFKALTNSYAGLEAGKSYAVSVRAMCNKDKLFYSLAGETKAVKILPVPSFTVSVGVDGADASKDVVNLSVNPVSGAASYRISWTHSDGKTSGSALVENASLTYSCSCEVVGDYTFKVQALAALESETYPSKLSDGILVKRQATPDGAALKSDPTDAIPRVAVAMEAQSNTFDVRIDGAGKQTFSSKNFTLTMPDDSAEEKSYVVTVRAAADLSNAKNLVLQSLDVYTFTVTRLAKTVKPSIVNDDAGGRLIWNPIDKANGYAVYGKNAAESYDNSTQAFLTLAGLSAGTYNFKIQAKGNGSNVLASAVGDGTQAVKLAAPSAISRASVDAALQWNAVSSATGYTVNVNGKSMSVGTERTYTLQPALSATEGVSVQVRAIGSDENGVISSEFSSAVLCYRLSTPNGLAIDESGFKWNAVDNVSGGYDVYTGSSKNQLFTDRVTRGTSVAAELFRLESEKFLSVEYNLSVKAIGNREALSGKIYFDSDFSDLKTFTRLAAPQPQVSDGKYVWNAVAGARYDITAEAFTARSLAAAEYLPQWESPANLSLGKQKVTFKSVGDNENYLSSAAVDYYQWIEKLAQPSFTAAYVNGNLTITPALAAADADKGVKSFVINNGADNTVAMGKTFVFDMGDNGAEYKIFVKAVGNFFGTQKHDGSDFETYYLSSMDSAVKTFKKLAPPQNVKLTATRALTWDAVENAVKYEIIVNDTTYSAAGTTFSEVELPVGTTVRVRAVGNGTGTFDSKETEFVC